ncbi:MAG: SGNH/GDSL hydrolase family protein [Kiritimatiellae bacterium]|nr:SGNH/GDSL hydrolase family protein [Kiritimatiellia bacterium]
MKMQWKFVIRLVQFCTAVIEKGALVAAAICMAAASPSVGAELSDGAITTRVPLRNAPAAFAEKGAGTVAFLGGSITEANGFRPLVENSLTNRFPTAQLSFTRAGLSSTCSTAGAFRFGDDVLARGVPDALFVEFAVNDHVNPDHPYEVCLRGMEGIVRQARRANPKMDIVMVLFMTSDMLETVRAGNLPVSYAAHLAVAERYGIPTVNVAKALVNAEAAGTFTWTDYGGDCHPNAAGCQFISDLIDVLLDAEGWGVSVGASAPYELPAAIDAGCYENAHWIPSGRAALGDGWYYSVPDWSALSATCRANYKNDAILWSRTPGSVMTVEFTGTDFGAFVLAGNDAGVLEISIDGDAFTSHPLYDTQYSKTLQLPYARVFRSGLANGRHTAVLRSNRYGTNGNVGGTAVRLFRIGANGIAGAGNVTWEAPCDVTGDADVDTTGAFRYAYGIAPNVVPYNSATTTVNGVTFFEGSRTANGWRAADLKFQGFGSAQNDSGLAWAAGIATEGDISAPYRTMLGCGLYSTVSPHAASITFRRLVPGRRYLVQLWCSRGGASGSGETVTLDNSVTLSTGGASSGDLRDGDAGRRAVVHVRRERVQGQTHRRRQRIRRLASGHDMHRTVAFTSTDFCPLSRCGDGCVRGNAGELPCRLSVLSR